MEDMKALLPCPFCLETQIKLMKWPHGQNIWEVFCLGCKVSTGAKFIKKEAVTAWNTRVESKQIKELWEQNQIMREALEDVNKLWDEDEGFFKEINIELKEDSPVLIVWKKIREALKSIKE